MAGTALFDLDKTLTYQGTWSRFVRGAIGPAEFWGHLPAVAGQAALYKSGRASRASVKEKAIARYFAGRSRAEMVSLAENFVSDELKGGLRPGALAAIAEHKARGDRMMIASAAVDLIVEPLGRALGFTDFICTELDWDASGALKSKLRGENCYGIEKLRRVRAAFADTPPAGPTYFYSDHITDLPCLLWADHGVAVNPSAKLRRVAPRHGLPVVNWNTPSKAVQLEESPSA